MSALRRFPVCPWRRKMRFNTILIILQIAAILVFVRQYAYRSATPGILDTDDSPEDFKRNILHEDSHNGLVEKTSFSPLQTIELNDTAKSDYFQDIGSAKSCFVQGTDIEATSQSQNGVCKCKEDYFGRECGIPAAAWYRYVQKEYRRMNLRPREIPRRVIHGLNVNHEIDLFEVRLEELQESVDVYIVCESNYTAHGDRKEFHLLEKLRQGYAEKFHSKLVYVQLTNFPKQGKKDGWFADMYLRTYMGVEGMRQIRGVRDDDLFVLLDADEIPSREVILFLKLYDGYPEPVRLAMRWSVFGFFWKRKVVDAESILSWVFGKSPQQDEEELVEVTAVSSIAMLREVCRNNTFLIRKDMSSYPKFQKRLQEYSKGRNVQTWTIGTKGHYAGYHCSWCYTPEGIRTKLLSAHVDDKPRWGDFPEKTDVKYIRKLIDNGEWFDGSKPFLKADPEKEKQYAPQFVLQHPERFSQILYLSH